jgi:hypothetical protein
MAKNLYLYLNSKDMPIALNVVYRCCVKSFCARVLCHFQYPSFCAWTLGKHVTVKMPNLTWHVL